MCNLDWMWSIYVNNMKGLSGHIVEWQKHHRRINILSYDFLNSCKIKLYTVMYHYMYIHRRNSYTKVA